MAKCNRFYPLAVSRVLASIPLFVVCGLLIVGVVGCALPSVGSNSLFRSHPSDERLIDNYYQHKNEFGQLAQMLLGEKYLLVIFPAGEGKCQIAGQKLLLASENSRCQQYVRFFNTLGLDWAYSGRDPLMLTVSNSGLTVSGSSKGYCYSTDPPGEIVDDTDANPPYEGIVFRHIDGHWYIFLEEW